MTQEQADSIRGNYGEFNSLNPVQFVEGWCLPISVLQSGCFDSIMDFLKALPIQEVTQIKVSE